MTQGKQTHKSSKGEIWAFGGGKGGTGKSFIASSFAVALAKSGKSVNIVDCDLGAPNLHTIFGISNPKKSLTDFFDRSDELKDLLVKTSIKNLTLVPGDIQTLSSTKMKYFLLKKLYRQIRAMHSDYTLVDVGAGSNTNVLDTFLLADKMIAVLNPDLLSMDNFYKFIKSVLYRKITYALKPYGFRDLIDQVWNARRKYKIKNIWDLLGWLMKNFPFTRTIIEKEVANFAVYFIINQTRNVVDIHQGEFIKSGFKKYLNLTVQYIGYVEYRPEITRSVEARRPFMVSHANTQGGYDIQTCLDNLLESKEARLPKI